MASARRLAAIMFTDIVGFTALGQRNESLSLALLEEERVLLRPIFRRYDGKEIKTMGDGFLVEFSNALGAVRCAYEIQRSTREANYSRPPEQRVLLRVGVHLGDVVDTDGDISGDAVNVASRIEPLAEPGGVCITRQVYDQVQNKFELPLSSLGIRPLKNVSLPVEAYKMVMPWHKEDGVAPARPDQRRIVVLPLTNMSPDPMDEFFADGLTEELTSTISKIGGLGVISRTSAMQYKGKPKPVAEIGRELNAGTVLEGSVRKAGNRIRVAMQMIDTAKDEHVWAENYDREMQDVFAIQGDIAQHVAENLKIRLLSEDKEGFSRKPTESTEAYTLYLKGRYHFRTFTKDGFEKSLDFYRRSLVLDPRFAYAYAGTASTHNWQGFLNMVPDKEAYPKAREFAERALELDDSIAECHYILGRVLIEFYWAFATGEAELFRSIKLNPSDPKALLAHSWFLASKLQAEQAMVEAERAVQLDPKSSDTWWSASYTCYLLSRFDRGLEYGLKAIDANPLDPYAHNLAGMNYLFSGEPEKAITEMREELALSNNGVFDKMNMGWVLGLAGRHAEARAVLEDLLQIAKTETVPAMMIAQVYAGLGDADPFFEWLQKAYEEHAGFLVYSNHDPGLAGLRSDPRFSALMKKIGMHA